MTDEFEEIEQQIAGLRRIRQIIAELCGDPEEWMKADLIIADQADESADTMTKLFDEVQALRRRNQKLEAVARAADWLRAEVTGMLALERESIAELVSETNMQCLERRLNQTIKALTDLKGDGE